MDHTAAQRRADGQGGAARRIRGGPDQSAAAPRGWEGSPCQRRFAGASRWCVGPQKSSFGAPKPGHRPLRCTTFVTLARLFQNIIITHSRRRELVSLRSAAGIWPCADGETSGAVPRRGRAVNGKLFLLFEMMVLLHWVRVSMRDRDRICDVPRHARPMHGFETWPLFGLPYVWGEELWPRSTPGLARCSLSPAAATLWGA